MTTPDWQAAFTTCLENLISTRQELHVLQEDYEDVCDELASLRCELESMGV